MTRTVTCTEGLYRHDTTDVVYGVVCPRCGRYEITGENRKAFQIPLPKDVALRLSGLARRDSHLLIGRNYEQTAKLAPVPTRPTRYYELILEFLAQESPRPGATIKVDRVALAAWAYLPVSDCFSLLVQMKEQRKLVLSGVSEQSVDVLLLEAGWKNIEELERGVRGDRAFVAMSFHQDRHFFDDGFTRALDECGFNGPYRTDDDPGHTKHHERIDDRILGMIRASNLVVADATGARPNVFYEAGLAAGLGIPVLWTCQQGHEDDLPFDTRQFEHVIWTDAADLREKLVDRIRARGWDRDPSRR